MHSVDTEDSSEISDDNAVNIQQMYKTLKKHVSIPANIKKPLSWDENLLEKLPKPNQRSFPLSQFLTYENFIALHTMVKNDFDKVNNIKKASDEYKEIDFTKGEIAKIIRFLKSKKKRTAKNKELTQKLQQYKSASDDDVKKNLLNILLYAFSNKQHAKICLSIVEYFLPKKDRLYIHYPDDISKNRKVYEKTKEEEALELPEVNEANAPLIFYDMLTTDNISAQKLRMFKKCLTYLSEKFPDYFEKAFLEFYEGLTPALNQRLHAKKLGELKKGKNNHSYSLPAFNIARYVKNYDLSYMNLPGFRIIGGGTYYNFNLACSNLKSSLFYGNYTYKYIAADGGGALIAFNFTRAQLDYSVFKNIIVLDSDFSYGSLKSILVINSVFERCDFYGADLDHADLDDVTFMDCNFVKCNFNKSHNKILRIKIDEIQNKQEYTNDWIQFKELTNMNTNLTVSEINQRILLPIRAAQTLSIFSYEEKQILFEVEKAIENFPNTHFGYILRPKLQSSEKLRSLFEYLFLHSQNYSNMQFDVSRTDRTTVLTTTTSSISTRGVTTNERIIVKYTNTIPVSSTSQSDAASYSLIKTENKAVNSSSSSIIDPANSSLDMKISLDESDIAKEVNQYFKFKKNPKIPNKIVFDDNILNFIKSNPLAKSSHPEIKKNLANILKYAMWHPDQAEICLKIARAFIPKDELSYHNYCFSKQKIKDDEIAFILYDALTIKHVSPIKAKIFSKVFSKLSKNRNDVFYKYAQFYSKLSNVKNHKRYIYDCYSQDIFSDYKRKRYSLINVPVVKIKGKINNRNFSHTYFHEVSFEGVIRDSNFYNAYLEYSKWYNTKIIGCNFERSQLHGAENEFFILNLKGVEDQSSLLNYIIFKGIPYDFDRSISNTNRVLQLALIGVSTLEFLTLDEKKCLTELIRLSGTDLNASLQTLLSELEKNHFMVSNRVKEFVNKLCNICNMQEDRFNQNAKEIANLQNIINTFSSILAEQGEINENTSHTHLRLNNILNRLKAEKDKDFPDYQSILSFYFSDIILFAVKNPKYVNQCFQLLSSHLIFDDCNRFGLESGLEYYLQKKHIPNYNSLPTTLDDYSRFEACENLPTGFNLSIQDSWKIIFAALTVTNHRYMSFRLLRLAMQNLNIMEYPELNSCLNTIIALYGGHSTLSDIASNEYTYLRNAKLSDIKNCDLSYANLELTEINNIAGENTVEASFSNSKFHHARMSGFQYDNVKIFECEFNFADLSDSYLSNSNVSRGNFQHVNWSNSEIDNVHYHSCDFQNADLKGSFIRNIVFSNCNLQSVNLTAALIEGGNFRGSYTDIFSISDKGKLIFKENVKTNEKALKSAMLLAVWNEYLEMDENETEMRDQLMKFIENFDGTHECNSDDENLEEMSKTTDERTFAQIVQDFCKTDNMDIMDDEPAVFSFLEDLSKKYDEYLETDSDLLDETTSEEEGAAKEMQITTEVKKKSSQIDTAGMYARKNLTRTPTYFMNNNNNSNSSSSYQQWVVSSHDAEEKEKSHTNSSDSDSDEGMNVGTNSSRIRRSPSPVY